MTYHLDIDKGEFSAAADSRDFGILQVAVLVHQCIKFYLLSVLLRCQHMHLLRSDCSYFINLTMLSSLLFSLFVNAFSFF